MVDEHITSLRDGSCTIRIITMITTVRHQKFIWANTRREPVHRSSALVEAIHLCNVERNGDVVSMTSYAPLLAKDKHNNWNPDMIYFSNTDIRTTPSYETQRIFSKYAGDKYITSSIEMDNNLKISCRCQCG